MTKTKIKITEQQYDAAKAKLIEATAEFWNNNLRDKTGRSVPVDHREIEDTVYALIGDYSSTARDPEQTTPEEVLASLREFLIDCAHYDGRKLRIPACMRRELEGLDALFTAH